MQKVSNIFMIKWLNVGVLAERCKSANNNISAISFIPSILIWFYHVDTDFVYDLKYIAN